MQVWARLENGDHQKTDRKVTMPISVNQELYQTLDNKKLNHEIIV